jgi:hypothetical protein
MKSADTTFGGLNKKLERQDNPITDFLFVTKKVIDQKEN